MREILFRGIDEGTNEWVCGYYYEKPSDFGGERRYYIFYDKTITKYNVMPETVGQYIGFTDKNGKKIFEGDIVKIYLLYDVVDIGFIRYSNDSCRFQFVDQCSVGYSFDDTDVIEVIGNIHDNPELLKGGE